MKYNIKSVFLLTIEILLVVILLLVTALGSYMFIRRCGQLKNNSLSTKLEAYNIENDFCSLGDKFDNEFDNILFCGIDNFNNTDVIMLISVNKKLHKINVLRIPRDVYVGDNYNTGKINAVYSQPKPNLTGADTLTYELNNIFRIKVDKYIFMTLDVFQDMINDINGVDIVLDKDISIDEGHVIKAGNVHLDGKEGADFVRHRRSYVTGDIGRIYAQEKFVKSLGKKLIEDKYLRNVPFLNKYYKLIETNIGRKEVNKYTKSLKDVDVDQIKTFVLEGTPVMHNGYSVYVVDIDKTVKLLNQHFMPQNSSIKNKDLKLVKYLEPDTPKNKSKDIIADKKLVNNYEDKEQLKELCEDSVENNDFQISVNQEVEKDITTDINDNKTDENINDNMHDIYEKGEEEYDEY